MIHSQVVKQANDGRQSDHQDQVVTGQVLQGTLPVQEEETIPINASKRM